MQIANCVVSLGGDSGNTVPKFAVTAAEIAVLRAIHGDEAVNDIEPIGDVKRSNREERARVGAIYGQARDPETKKSIVEGMFPGVAARVFETIAELELDASFFKPTGRMTAPAAPTEERPSGRRNGRGKAKAEAAPQTDTEATDEADEGVGEDINDEHAEPNVLG